VRQVSLRGSAVKHEEEHRLALYVGKD